MNKHKPVFYLFADEEPETAFKRCLSEQHNQMTEDVWLLLLVTLTDVIGQKNAPGILQPCAANLRLETGTELRSRLEGTAAK
ncbi:hypothetical protein I2494_20010 [Budviciaceae bacterium BWR-B9]|uniref:Uncharacterized protein n=1 Tax=Limnobaculum allomyrinae TaxID=2791986 RepID=A0ABS1IW11_9GAMM|nr:MULTISPECIES: hypothetical protein [Limnobaculum]MBK5145957.1 hypothetical protein [Limnobaculum allomyrinae]MBV7693988.1 hypothetical protein [Limnobaculum sp. M2-1]